MQERKSSTLVPSLLRMALALSAATPAATLLAEEPGPDAFVVCYASETEVAAFEPYPLVVLDAEHHPPLAPLVERGKTVLGYVSLGEVDSGRRHFEAARDGGILLSENPHWPGSYRVDLRSPVWTKLVLERLVPAALDEGFAGVFLDTLDNAPHLERLDPDAFAGMTSAAERLVIAIRERFPGAVLIMNRAYELLPSVEIQIDYVLGESVRADYDFERGHYRLVPEGLYRQQVVALQEAQRRQPRLRVLTLDYWDPDDPSGLREIYRQQRANGFVPYVGTLELDRIVPEPPAHEDATPPSGVPRR